MSSHTDLLNLTYYRGRVALYALLKGLGVSRGDHVATQAFTCVAVPEGILATGATPLYIDLEQGGYNLDPDDLLRKITPQTKAIVVQHTFGIPAKMHRIMEIANAAGIPVIEDCCHTLETTISGQKVGTFGVGAFYSYEWGKPVVVGIGGSARVNDPNLAERMAEDRQHYLEPGIAGKIKLAIQYQVHNILYRPSFYWPLKSLFHQLSRLGVAKGNYNSVSVDDSEFAEDFRLAMGTRQRQHLASKLAHRIDEYTNHSTQIVERILGGLQGQQHLQFPTVSPEDRAVYARLPIRVSDKARVIAKAKEQSIELAEWYTTPIHPIPVSQGRIVAFEQQSCPEAEKRTNEVVSLPLHHRVKESYIHNVVEFLSRVA